MAVAMADNCHGCLAPPSIANIQSIQSMFNPLYLLKQAPPFRNAGVVDGSTDKNWWNRMWLTLEFFNEVIDELHWDERLNEWNHSPLHPYLVTAIGDTYPLESHGGQLKDVLYQPKYEEDVFYVRYEPYGPWDHFPSGIYGQPSATRRRGSDSDSDSDSDSSSSGSSLTSADEEEEEASS